MPPIGPMTEKQRRAETARRLARDIELPLQAYFRQLASLRYEQVTPQVFADLQSSADDVSETLRRAAQSLYDLIDCVSVETTSEELLIAAATLIEIEQTKAERIKAACDRSRAKWEEQKRQSEAAKPVKRSWFGW